MAPKKKQPAKEVEAPTPTQTQAPNPPKETTIPEKPQPKASIPANKSADTNQQPAQTTQQSANNDKPEQLGHTELTKKTSTVIKLNETDPKVISLQGGVKSERDLKQLRAFKFGGKQTNISIDDASKLISERARKFGGNVPMTSEDRKKRLQKFGGTYVDKEEERELKKQRKAKFGNKQNESGSIVLPQQDPAIIQARRKKFVNSSVEVPNPQKKLKQQ